jgi:hypothetical protein
VFQIFRFIKYSLSRHRKTLSCVGISPGGDSIDHLYTYAGNDSIFKNSSNVPKSLRNKVFTSNMHLLAWEDLLHGGDLDYQDLVIVTSNLTPVPLPSTLALFGPVLLLAAIRRRKIL